MATHAIRIARAFVLFVSLAALAGAGGCAGARRPTRTIMVELEVEHFTNCNECSTKIANLLKTQEGVIRVKPLGSRPAAFVYFEDGGFDIDEARRMLIRAGYAAHVVWGPAAVAADGRFELHPIDEIPRRLPTLKERKDSKLVVSSGAPKSGFAPPENEPVPAAGD